MKNKINLKTPFPHPFILSNSSQLPHSGAGTQEMGITVSSSHVAPATLLRERNPSPGPAWVPPMEDNYQLTSLT